MIVKALYYVHRCQQYTTGTGTLQPICSSTWNNLPVGMPCGAFLSVCVVSETTVPGRLQATYHTGSLS